MAGDIAVADLAQHQGGRARLGQGAAAVDRYPDALDRAAGELLREQVQSL